MRAADLAEGRGTIDGIALAAKLYLDLDVQVVESFRDALALRARRSGRRVVASSARSSAATRCSRWSARPTYLGDEPPLGSSFLDETRATATGPIAFHFDVLVPARQVCSSEDLTPAASP